MQERRDGRRVQCLRVEVARRAVGGRRHGRGMLVRFVKAKLRHDLREVSRPLWGSSDGYSARHQIRVIEWSESRQSLMTYWRPSVVHSQLTSWATIYRKPPRQIPRFETHEHMFYSARKFNQPLDKWDSSCRTRQSLAGEPRACRGSRGTSPVRCNTLQRCTAQCRAVHRPLGETRRGRVVSRTAWTSAFACGRPVEERVIDSGIRSGCTGEIAATYREGDMHLFDTGSCTIGVRGHLCTLGRSGWSEP